MTAPAWISPEGTSFSGAEGAAGDPGIQTEGDDETVHGKRILSGILAICFLISACAAAAGDVYYASVVINGVRYRLANPSLYDKPSQVKKQAENLYAALEAYPQVKTYVYLANSSRCVDVVRDVSAVPPAYESIQEYFTKSVTDYLHIGSQEEYARYFYTTDHHWNYEGSYTAYCQMIRMMLGEEEPVLEPLETVTFPVKFNGSINRQSGRTDSEEFFTVYRFDYPEMKAEVNGVPKASYGHQETYLAGKYSRMPLANHYANFYGGDIGQLHLETGRTDRGNLLVFSNSFSNAVAMLLASHFHHTWIIDPRYYKNNTNKPFSLTDAVEEWNIDRILILGDGDYFSRSIVYQKKK